MEDCVDNERKRICIIRVFYTKKGFTFTRKPLIYCAVSVNPVF